LSSSSNRPAVEIDGLTKRYQRQRPLTDVLRGMAAKETLALDGVSLDIREGEVFGLLGPNGAGKTTLLKLLSTILSPTSGTARLFGIDVRQQPRRVRQLVGLVTAEERSLYWRLTARQNLRFFLSLYGVSGRQAETRIDGLLDLFMLTEVANVRVAEYSTGMRQKLSIARGLLSEPRLLFLDEPTRGLDPAAAHSLLQLVRERAVRHLENTVILTTHIAREVEQLCDRIATLNRGRVSYVGSVEGLVGTVDETVGYSLVIDELPDAVFSALRGKAGVAECRSTRREDGSIELELTLAYEAALSEVLRQLLFNNVTIVRCTVREKSLEETFRTVFGRTAPPPAILPATSSLR
jgi:ABC-2 type transport system ATP-binding protein